MNATHVHPRTAPPLSGRLRAEAERLVSEIKAHARRRAEAARRLDAESDAIDAAEAAGAKPTPDGMATLRVYEGLFGTAQLRERHAEEMLARFVVWVAGDAWEADPTASLVLRVGATFWGVAPADEGEHADEMTLFHFPAHAVAADPE